MVVVLVQEAHRHVPSRTKGHVLEAADEVAVFLPGHLDLVGQAPPRLDRGRKENALAAALPGQHVLEPDLGVGGDFLSG